MTFAGAKLALYLGNDLAVILRDDHAGLAFAGYWDLPGGGREGDESPLDCALRECREELGLTVPRASILWQHPFPEGDATKWFLVARMPASASQDIVFGNEGQRWALMSQAEFLSHPKAVPAFQQRLKRWIEVQDVDERPPAP